MAFPQNREPEYRKRSIIEGIAKLAPKRVLQFPLFKSFWGKAVASSDEKTDLWFLLFFGFRVTDCPSKQNKLSLFSCFEVRDILFPIFAELEQISKHPIKTHTILIDDMHCSETVLFDCLTKEDLKTEIFKINPHYEIYYVPGGNDGEYPQNVMVATIRNWRAFSPFVE